MIIFVLDSDGLIKLVKASIIEALLKDFSCFISKEVYEEVVMEGKKRLYEDSFAIESLVGKKMLKVKEIKKDKKASKILKDIFELGKGERSTLYLFFNLKADAIISDDNAFLKVLKANKIPFIIPSDIISRLVELKLINKELGIKALNAIEHYIRRENYSMAKKVVEGAS